MLCNTMLLLTCKLQLNSKIEKNKENFNANVINNLLFGQLFFFHPS